MPPSICFRFDIDTHKCIEQGVPGLLAFAREHSLRFSFFVNMGKATDRGAILRGLLRKNSNSDSRINSVGEKFSNRERLGLKAYVKIVLANPQVGKAHPAMIRRILDEGHEVGLHGGRNHGTWQRFAAGWDKKRLKEEVRYSRDLFADLTGTEPKGFTSPGFETSPALVAVLDECGFEFCSDSYGMDRKIRAATASLVEIPCTITGTNGISYLENLRARGMGGKDIRKHFGALLEQGNPADVVYEHPCYAGLDGLEYLSDIVDEAQARGREIKTLEEIRADFVNNAQ